MIELLQSDADTINTLGRFTSAALHDISISSHQQQ